MCICLITSAVIPWELFLCFETMSLSLGPRASHLGKAYWLTGIREPSASASPTLELQINAKMPSVSPKSWSLASIFGGPVLVPTKP